MTHSNTKTRTSTPTSAKIAYFNRKFFRRWQYVLLFLLNAPVIRLWARWVLRVNGDRSSVGDRRIEAIWPHAIFWLNGDQVSGEFRTHKKFAKRIYHAFRPLWDLYFATVAIPVAADGFKFGKAGFAKRQPLLLYLLNGPVRKWFRRVMCIDGDRSSVGDREIVRIDPNAIWWIDGEEYVAEFRTHAKYSKRVFHAFKPLFEAFHFWDWLVADRFLPALSFGFNNYTAYPDPNPESTTVDGQVEEWPVNVTFSALRTGTGTGAFPSVTGPGDNFFILKSNATTDKWDGLGRTIFLFDTSPLTSSATVSSGTFSLYVGSKNDWLSTSPSLAVVSSAPASNTDLVAGDFDSLGSTEFVTRIAYSSVATSAYNNMSLNASGLSAVSKTGVTKYGVREGEFDLDGGAPTWATNTSSEVNGYFADQTGTTYDPKLVVAYTLNTGSVLTAYPDADPETTTTDGEVFHGYGSGSGVSWASIIGAAGNGVSSNGTTNTGLFILSDSGSGNWRYCVRYGMTFDTTPIAATSIISSATVSLYGVAKEDTLGATPSVNLYTFAPASNSDIAAGDYDSFGSTALCDTTVTWANLSTTTWVNWALNATGIAAITRAGVTKIGMRNTEYDIGATSPTWSSNLLSQWEHYAADQTGTSTDPKLVVNYTVNPIAFVQAKGDKGNVSSHALVMTSSVTAGNTIIVCAYSSSPAYISSVTDSLSNSYTRVYYNATTTQFEYWEAANITGGSCTVTVTLGGTTPNWCGAVAIEYSGLKTSGSYDTAEEDTAIQTASTSPETLTISPTYDGCVTIGGVINSPGDWVTVDPGGSETERYDGDGTWFDVLEFVQGNKVSMKHTWTTSSADAYYAAIASFQPQIGGASSVPVFLHHLRQQGIS